MKVYDGSMMEWSNLEELPIETGIPEGAVGALDGAAAADGAACE